MLITSNKKARALLGKQHHKAQNLPAMNWKELPAFYQTLCKTKTMTQLTLRFLILTSIRTRPLRHIYKNYIDGNIWTLSLAREYEKTTECYNRISRGLII
ncbi:MULTISPECIES: hypothetical protein [unclassified Bartonella]|uniref:hypothetical protein n=1 Tax=unclassified Bartonella TaxID=2645622 RepID=UPI0035CF04DC